jgi:hypothetical protein
MGFFPYPLIGPDDLIKVLQRVEDAISIGRDVDDLVEIDEQAAELLQPGLLADQMQLEGPEPHGHVVVEVKEPPPALEHIAVAMELIVLTSEVAALVDLLLPPFDARREAVPRQIFLRLPEGVHPLLLGGAQQAAVALDLEDLAAGELEPAGWLRRSSRSE